MKPFLKSAWEERHKLHAESNKLWAEGTKIRAKGDKLCAEGDKLHIEARKLYVEGDMVYVQRVLDYYGPKAVINWDMGEVEGEVLAIPFGELR